MSLLKIYEKDKIEHNKDYYSAPQYSALKVLGAKIPPYFFESIEFKTYEIILQKLDTEYLNLHEIKVIETAVISDNLEYNNSISFKQNKTNGSILDYSHFFRLQINLIDPFRTKIYYSDLFCCKQNDKIGDYNNDYNNDY